jgi:predicted amino acid racemase
MSLARLCFDEGEYGRVVNLLSGLYDGRMPDDINEQEEMYGRMMFAISLLAVGEGELALRQTARIQYLCRVLGAGGEELVAAVRQAGRRQGASEYSIALG